MNSGKMFQRYVRIKSWTNVSKFQHFLNIVNKFWNSILFRKSRFRTCSHYSNPEHIFQLWTLFWTCEHFFNNVNKISIFLFVKANKFLKKWSFLENLETPWAILKHEHFLKFSNDFSPVNKSWKTGTILGSKNFKTTNILENSWTYF